MREFVFRWRGALAGVTAAVVLFFGRPSPTGLMLGACLAVMGEMLRLWALGYAGLPTRRQYLDAPRLITAGPYAHLRNPLYLGNLLNGMAVATAAVGGLPAARAAGLWMAAALFLLFVYHNIIVLEQEFLHQQFGADYEQYCRDVPSLIPSGLRQRSAAEIRRGDFSLPRALQFERMTLVWQALIWAILLVKTVKEAVE